MSETYIAWNGQPYPWPPPEGWYRGSDGRWWAPGSGPEPHTGSAEPSHQTPSPEPTPTDREPAGDESAPNEPAASESAAQKPADDEPGNRETADDKSRQPEEWSSDQHTVMAKPSPRTSAGQAGQVDEFDGSTIAAITADLVPTAIDGSGGSDEASSSDQVTEATNSGSSNRLLILVGAATLVLIGVGLVALSSRSDEDNTDASPPLTTAAPSNETEPSLTTTIVGAPDGDPVEETPPPSTEPDPGTTTVAPNETTTTTLDATPTTIDTTTTTSPPPTTAAATTTTAALAQTDAERATAWRNTLAAKGIDSSELSEEDIIDFGKSFCVFAVVSVDAAEFDTFRDKAQTGVAGALTEAQLSAAIDAAVVSFCPEEAARLGITI